MNFTRSVVDNEVREQVFEMLNLPDNFKRISNQSYGVTVRDLNDEVRMVEVKLTARKIDEEMDGEEMLDWEVEEYQRNCEEKAEKKKRLEEEKEQKKSRSRSRHRKHSNEDEEE